MNWRAYYDVPGVNGKTVRVVLRGRSTRSLFRFLERNLHNLGKIRVWRGSRNGWYRFSLRRWVRHCSPLGAAPAWISPAATTAATAPFRMAA